MRQGNIMPLAVFDEIELEEANDALVRWGHQMGELHRPFPSRAFGLIVAGELVGVATMDCLIRGTVGGIGREDAVELSRLCAEGPQWNRVVLRLWREIAFPSTGKRWAISYQDKGLHTGNLYRFDGWTRLGESRSGTDPRARGGVRTGRSKVIWGWERKVAAEVAA